MLVERDLGLLDVEVLQQHAGLACVLAGNEVDRAQGFEGAQRDVLQVADWSRDEIEHQRGCAQYFSRRSRGMFLRWKSAKRQLYRLSRRPPCHLPSPSKRTFTSVGVWKVLSPAWRNEISV